MLYLRGNVWWCKFKAAGKVHYLSTGLTDRNKAEQAAQILRIAAIVKPDREVVDKFLDSIYETGKKNVVIFDDCLKVYEQRSTAGHATKRDAAQTWRHFADWCFTQGVKSPLLVNADVADKWLAAQEGKGKTIKNRAGFVRAVWSAAAMKYKLPPCPIDVSRITTADSEVREEYTDDEIKRILQAAETDGLRKWKLPVLISRWTGLRLSSIVALDWSEIDTSGSPWVLRHIPVKTRAHGIKVVIPIADALRRELEQIPQAMRKGKIIKENMRLKTNKFADVLRAAGLETGGVRNFHSLRHSFRSALSAAGVSDDIAMRLGGWTAKETAARYDHAERIAEKLSAIEATRKNT